MDLLAPDRIGNKKERRPKQTGSGAAETARPALWAEKLEVTDWWIALSEAGIYPDDEITEEVFKRAISAHSGKVM
ncbi:MAG: hypothetical protein PVH29_14810 [Candidatus Zixiibacteriota bacterium]|jgi:hypothetical protein